MLNKKIKNHIEKTINTFLEENNEDINLYPYLRRSSLCISSSYIPECFMESKDSTILLDMDETLIHVLKVNKSLKDFFSNNPTEKKIINDNPDADIDWAKNNIKEFNSVLYKYKYKNYITVAPHQVFGYAIIIFRPGVKELINTIGLLIGSKDLKDVKVFTANMKWWADILVEKLNEYTNKNIQLYDGSSLSDDSKLIDDDEGSATIKLFKAKVIKNINDDVNKSWIQVKRFRGDLNDKELFKVIKSLKEVF